MLLLFVISMMGLIIICMISRKTHSKSSMHSVVHAAMKTIILLLHILYSILFLPVLIFLGNMMDVIGLIVLNNVFQRVPNRLIVSVLSVVRVTV